MVILLLLVGLVDFELSVGLELRAGQLALEGGSNRYRLEQNKGRTLVVMLSTAIGLRKHRIPSDLRS